VNGLATNEKEATMQNKPLRFIANLSLVLASVLLLHGDAAGDPRSNSGVPIDHRSGITAVESRSSDVHALAHDLGDKSVLTPHHNRLPNVLPGGVDRVVAGLEWIAAVPEPRAIVFLGTALLVASGIARRRFMRNGKVQKS
jgi:hypothetical protein